VTGDDDLRDRGRKHYSDILDFKRLTDEIEKKRAYFLGLTSFRASTKSSHVTDAFLGGTNTSTIFNLFLGARLEELHPPHGLQPCALLLSRVRE